MAVIDKCYASSYAEYAEFKEWAVGKQITTPRGQVINVSDFIYEWVEPDFNKNHCLPIFNSPIYFDNYLYHNCHIGFIQEWLIDRYADFDGVLDRCITETPKLPDYPKCTKVKAIQKGFTKSNIIWYVSVDLLSEYAEKYGCKRGWVNYNDAMDTFILPCEYEDYTSSNANLKGASIRSIIRKILRRWKLPVGCKVTVKGCFVGDKWVFITK